MGQATAQMNISDLRKVLGLPEGDLSPDSIKLVNTYSNQPSPALHRYRVRRESMNHLDIIKVCACFFLYHLVLVPRTYITSLFLSCFLFRYCTFFFKEVCYFGQLVS